MMQQIKIGRLIQCTVVRFLPEPDSYLAVINGTESLAYLPRKYASRQYREGSGIVAAVFLFDDGKTILSQRSPQYFRRIAEEILTPVIRDGRIRVRKAASVMNGPFAKVAIEGISGADPLNTCLPYLEKAKMYTDDTITIVRYSENIKEYIVNALVPAPADKVLQVLYSHALREAIVRVETPYCGYFVGKGGANVATAAKLINVKIAIKGAQQEVPTDAQNGERYVRAHW